MNVYPRSKPITRRIISRRAGDDFLSVEKLVSPVGGPHSLRKVVGTAVTRNCRKTALATRRQCLHRDWLRSMTSARYRMARARAISAPVSGPARLAPRHCSFATGQSAGNAQLAKCARAVKQCNVLACYRHASVARACARQVTTLSCVAPKIVILATSASSRAFADDRNANLRLKAHSLSCAALVW